MIKKKNDTEQIRLKNRRQLIETLRVFGPLARVDIGQKLKLSAATVTAITADLINDGLLHELQSESSKAGVKRGRPRVLVDLNSESVNVLGVKLSVNEIRLMLGNMKGDIVTEEVIELITLDLSSGDLLKKLIELIEAFVSQHSTQAVSSIGIAIQGFVDANKGEIVWSPALTQRHIPLAEPLQKHFSVPVIIANDANCLALAIRSQPVYQGLENFVVIMLGYGVGMGMIVRGHLYSGHHGAAAEFGHTKYQPDGVECRCGKRGCIEAYVSDYAILRDAHANLQLQNLLGQSMQGQSSSQKSSSIKAQPNEQEMQKLVELAKEENQSASQLFENSGKVLGYGIANVLAMISPDRVVISGPGVRAYQYMEEGIQLGLENALVSELISETIIEPFPWQEDLTGRGVLTLALKLVD